MVNRVAVTGLGLVTPVGNTVGETWDALCRGVSGVGLTTRFDTSAFSVKIAAEVQGFDPALYMDRKEIRRSDINVWYAVAAVKQAVADAELTITDAIANDTGVIIGSGIAASPRLDEHFQLLREGRPDRITPFLSTIIMPDAASGVISMMLGAKGPNFCTSSACATSANAIGEAADKIRFGRAQVMIAGGTEALISEIGIAAFASARALSRRNDDPATASRPFDATRDGFVMGDGAGVLVLEDWEFARRRGARIYCELAGYGATSDAYHITEPAPGGEGLVRAMRIALDQANLPPEAVDYINAHGTATVYNDRTETIATKTVFGEHAYRLAISSSKSMIGHTIGAAGGIEAAITVLSLAHGVMPPTINLHHPDPECDLDYVPNEARRQPVRVALSNSMGFGGHNACLLFRRDEGEERL
jgi:3-oxoacyl-[acyl-carrier-protein] synthase II